MQSRRLVIGVTGGIAAYKTAALVSQLVQKGAEVSVVMTEAAERFIGGATFQALTGRRVVRELFDPQDFHLGAHIELAAEAELVCVAPATADFLAKLAHGLADDVLSTLLLAFEGPVVLAPAMSASMWHKPAVVRNVEILKRDGSRFVDPEEGWLSCRQRGPGRMADPAAIEEAILEALPRR
jgi:phosphopantothenoylcysteine decarboxylase/phosphopantothenate--cysteine ligase